MSVILLTKNNTFPFLVTTWLSQRCPALLLLDLLCPVWLCLGWVLLVRGRLHLFFGTPTRMKGIGMAVGRIDYRLASTGTCGDLG